MKKRNFYMVQVDIVYGDETFKSSYLPYAAGLLAAYALEDPTLAENYELKRMIFIMEDLEEVVASMEDPYFVGFSNYVWSTPYNKRLAKKIKERYPDCIILFGGHNVPPNNDFLEEFPYIDLLIHGEGEIPFKALLQELLKENPDFAALPSLSYRDAAGIAHKTETIIPEGLDYPSPYLMGYFDQIVEDYPEIRFSAILETSRGCPYQCAYCDWALLKSKIRQFPLERVFAEITWMADHKIEYLWGADSNFGFFDRDEQIVDYMIDKKERTGYPEKIRINYAKHNEDIVFRIVKKLHQSEISKFGATLSFQSLNPTVLENIGRKNMDFEHFKSLMLRYNSENIRTYSELILGLPGETYESYCQGIGTLLAAGQHSGIDYYRCVLLPNSRMGQPEFIEKHGIKHVEGRILQVHCHKEKAWPDGVFRTVVATNTLSEEEWVRANLFTVLMQGFHSYGLLRFFAVYLYNERGVPYEDFYNALADYYEAEAGPVIQGFYRKIKKQILQSLHEEQEDSLVVEEVAPIRWMLDEFVFLSCVYHLDEFYTEIEPFLRRFGLEETLFENLFRYQKEMVKTPTASKKDIPLDYDFYAYFSKIYVHEYQPLEKRANIVHAHDPGFVPGWAAFMRFIVWFGRMGGKSLFDDVQIEYVETEA